MQTASAGLISALKSSLADSAAGWAVVDIDETTDKARQTTVTATDAGAVSTTSTSVVTVRLRLKLVAQSVPIAVGAKSALRMTYTQVTEDGSFTEGQIGWGSSVLRTTDSALNTTIVTLAAPFLTAGDDALKATLQAGPQAGLAIPADLLTAIKASLASPAAGWQVRGFNRIVLDDGTAQAAVVLNSLESIVTVGTIDGTRVAVPCVLSYLYTLSARQILMDAKIMVDGLEWRTLDAALSSTIIGLAAAYQSTRSAGLTTEITLG
mgnify:CR=1 FL=1